jgi:nitrile hydratase subunit beta
VQPGTPKSALPQSARRDPSPSTPIQFDGAEFSGFTSGDAKVRGLEMNGVHDLGGMDGFGPVVREQDEPAFHSEWERRVFALTRSTMAARCFNVHEFRRTIERMPPVQYLSASYYERWLYAVEALLAEKGIISRDELEGAMRDQVERSTRFATARVQPAARMSGRTPDHKARKPRFRVGEHVFTRNINPPGHTRMPRYARGKRGIIRYDWGVFVFPDSHAHGLGRDPQHCYGVEFKGRELWGQDHPVRERVYLDLWEDYLEPDRESGAKVNQVRTRPAPARASAAGQETRGRLPARRGRAR